MDIVTNSPNYYDATRRTMSSPDSQQYLPSFLLGDLPPAPQLQSPPAYALYSPPRSSGVSGVTHEGPPTVGLFDDPPGSPNQLNKSINSSVLDTSGLGTSPTASTANENSSPGCWVVVFGYRPGDESSVLSLMGSCGRIVEVSSPPGGNWAAVRFANRDAARSALNMNGNLLAGNIMIGIIPGRQGFPLCRSNKDDSVNTSVLGRSMTSPGGVRNSPLSPRVRPLTAKRPSEQQNQVGVSVDSGIVGKVMDMIFSW